MSLVRFRPGAKLRTNPAPYSDPLGVNIRLLCPLLRGLNLVNGLEEPKVPLHWISQFAALEPGPPAIDDDNDGLEATCDVVSPISPVESLIDLLRAWSAVPKKKRFQS